MTSSDVLLTTFNLGSKKVKVVFHDRVIVWDNVKAPFDQKSLSIEDVLSVKENYLKCSNPTQDLELDPYSFTIHYGVRNGSSKWKYKNLIFKHNDPSQISTWIKALSRELEAFKHRPKHLLLFVNPFGGRRKSMQVYTKYGKPLFDIAGVDVTVNVSQRKDQIRDFLINYNLELFDSIACVGGDGTLSELFNGLVLRQSKSDGVNYDDMKSVLPRPKFTVGVIPGGSTDTVAYCLHGTTDPTTAVFHIIYGDTVGLDLVSVYNERNLLKLYASVLSYGYLGDVAFSSEKYRWMGPQRYNYSGFKKLILNKGYYGELAVLSDMKDISPEKCFENCDTCNLEYAYIDGKRVQAQWKTISGKYFMISGANISCACGHSPNGIAPYSHLGDGNIHLVLVKHGSIIDNLKLLLNLSNKNKKIEDLPFVKTLCVKEFCFRATGAASKWNCDGEIQPESNIRAKVNRQLLSVYSRRRPKINEDIREPGCCGF